MALENLLTEWARLLLASFADAGVREVVLSPGSRSTPFLIAAAQEPRLRCIDSIDERAAAFLALGQARITGRPSLLLCTSGSAGAHYFPAVVEASMAAIPLIVLTADRPVELQACGAAQTIDQLKLYGNFVRAFADLGTPDGSPGALRALRRNAFQAVHTALGPQPGPVHLNARAGKPLEPVAATTAEELAVRARVDALLAGRSLPAVQPVLAPAAEGLEDLGAALSRTERGLIVCGPAPLHQGRVRSQLFELAQRTGYPILAEAASQLRFGPVPEGVAVIDGFDLLLRVRPFVESFTPDLVLQLGAAPVSGAYEKFSETTAAAQYVVAPNGWNDPHSRASQLIFSELEPMLSGLNARLGPNRGGRGEWTRGWADANQQVWTAVGTELAEQNVLTEGQVARSVVAQAPEGSLLSLGNSLAIREVDSFCPAGGRALGVLCQRGANGIDGLVAGAVGSVRASAKPLTLLIGDVSFLHDLTSLGLANALEAPLVCVVIQNFGGRIFETLPIARSPAVSPSVLAHVTTPHRVEFEHAARLFGHRYRRVTTTEQLETALRGAYAEPACTVIEAVVAEHGAAEQQQRLTRAVASLVALKPSATSPSR